MGAGVAVFVVEGESGGERDFFTFESGFDGVEERLIGDAGGGEEGVGDAAVFLEAVGDGADGEGIPAGVNEAKFSEVEPEGEGAEPVEGGTEFVGGKLVEGGGVLSAIFVGVWSEEFAGVSGIGGGVGEGVEFVVAHDGECGACVDHAADDLESFADEGAAIDEVAEEEDFALGVRIGRTAASIAEFFEESGEFVRMPVDVADDVVHEGIDSKEFEEILGLSGSLAKRGGGGQDFGVKLRWGAGLRAEEARGFRS